MPLLFTLNYKGQKNRERVLTQMRSFTTFIGLLTMTIGILTLSLKLALTDSVATVWFLTSGIPLAIICTTIGLKYFFECKIIFFYDSLLL